MGAFVQTGRFNRGYHPDQVERFFTHARATYEGRLADGAPDLSAHQVRVVGFELVRGGYDIHQVDSALDRLEDELARREREQMRRDQGDEVVIAELRRRALKLSERLGRPAGERFDRAERFTEKAYDATDVDALCDRLLQYFHGDAKLSPDHVRQAIFRSRRGRQGYRESQVDVFLDRVVELMVFSD